MPTRLDGDAPSLAPSVATAAAASVRASTQASSATAVGIGLTTDGDLPDDLDRDVLRAAGFTGAVGETLALPASGGPVRVLVGLGGGLGRGGGVTADAVRDAAAHFARAAASHGDLAAHLPPLSGVATDHAARAVVEGVLLARYRYDVLKSAPTVTAVSSLTVVVDEDRLDDASTGVARGVAMSRATALSRDLANAPPSLLTAEGIAEVASSLGPERGLEVEVFGEEELVELGCGGLLGVNAGSVHPPRMVVLRYRPTDGDGKDGEPTGRLTLVGKGIMYDSGGLALKPGDATHANMKNDMSGAGAILAAMLELDTLDCPAAVTGYLMCTDNMPSGTATAMGDVLRIRGGTTVEVANTDAEGRLVMADALVLAREEEVDAIVDVATLTGACMAALGTQVAGVMGTSPDVVSQVEAAAATSGESVWELPLEGRYRTQLDSEVADIKNLGGPTAGAITAGLFLAEFVDDVPWAHLDIAGVAQNDRDAVWRPPGNTGFGARLLLDLAQDFTPPTP